MHEAPWRSERSEEMILQACAANTVDNCEKMATRHPFRKTKYTVVLKLIISQNMIQLFLALRSFEPRRAAALFIVLVNFVIIVNPLVFENKTRCLNTIPFFFTTAKIYIH